jgi:hypothetical protein
MRLIKWTIIAAIAATWELLAAGPPYVSRIVAWFSQMDERLSSIPPGFWLLFLAILALWHFYEAKQDDLALRQQETQRLLKEIAEHTERISRTTSDTHAALERSLDHICDALQDLHDKTWR